MAGGHPRRTLPECLSFEANSIHNSSFLSPSRSLRNDSNFSGTLPAALITIQPESGSHSEGAVVAGFDVAAVHSSINEN